MHSLQPVVTQKEAGDPDVSHILTHIIINPFKDKGIKPQMPSTIAQ